MAARSADLGKQVGDDFREGKITLPVVLSYRRGSDADRAFWRRVLVEGEIGDGDLEHADRADATATGRSRTRSSAPAISARSPATPWRPSPIRRTRSALLEAVDFCIAPGATEPAMSVRPTRHPIAGLRRRRKTAILCGQGRTIVRYDR